MSGHEFWAKDMSAVNDKKGWFNKLSPQRKIIFILTAVFVVAWCFFLGMQIAKADDPGKDDWYIATSDDLGDKEFLSDAAAIDGMYTMLLVGCDEREGYETGRSDTMMLCFVNANTNEISLLSIPRDCYVQIPGYSTKTKINHSYSYGGVNLTVSTIEYFLGIHIDDYVEVGFDGFVELVDALGGVEINVDQRMINYDEGVNLDPGLQTLDGKQALGYCRFRIGQDGTATVSDIKRAEHQQNFILALKDKLVSLSTVTKIPKLVTLVNRYVNTSMSTSQAIGLANSLLGMNMDNIKRYTVPTTSMWINAVSYEIVDAAGTRDILNKIVGSEYEIEPHIIDDGGEGRYTLPAGTQEITDDIPPEITGGDADSDTDDTSSEQSPDNGGESGDNENTGGDNEGGDNGGGSVDDIPEPAE